MADVCNNIDNTFLTILDFGIRSAYENINTEVITYAEDIEDGYY